MYPEDREPTPIGYKRLFETMLFVIKDDGEPVDWCPGIYDAGYNDHQEAQDGHEAACKYAEKNYMKILRETVKRYDSANFDEVKK